MTTICTYPEHTPGSVARQVIVAEVLEGVQACNCWHGASYAHGHRRSCHCYRMGRSKISFLACVVNGGPSLLEIRYVLSEAWITLSMLPSATPACHSELLEQSCVPMNSLTSIAPFDACSTKFLNATRPP